MLEKNRHVACSNRLQSQKVVEEYDGLRTESQSMVDHCVPVTVFVVRYTGFTNR